MVRVKPAGITLRVWREIATDAQKKVCKIKKLDKRQAELDRLTEAHAVEAAQRAAEEAERARLAPPKLKRGGKATIGPLPKSKVNTLKGALDGWTEEKRTTGNGRKYTVFHSPSGQQFMSRVTALRSIGACG